MRKCLGHRPNEFGPSCDPLALHSADVSQRTALHFRCATALDSGDRFIVALEAMLVGHLTPDFRLARAYARSQSLAAYEFEPVRRARYSMNFFLRFD
jgi:hypothetical protein